MKNLKNIMFVFNIIFSALSLVGFVTSLIDNEVPRWHIPVWMVLSALFVLNTICFYDDKN